eukprot:XP_025005042.1 uncharacterized protein LOC107053185 [Gallus gallus]
MCSRTSGAGGVGMGSPHTIPCHALGSPCAPSTHWGTPVLYSNFCTVTPSIAMPPSLNLSCAALGGVAPKGTQRPPEGSSAPHPSQQRSGEGAQPLSCLGQPQQQQWGPTTVGAVRADAVMENPCASQGPCLRRPETGSFSLLSGASPDPFLAPSLPSPTDPPPPFSYLGHSWDPRQWGWMLLGHRVCWSPRAGPPVHTTSRFHGGKGDSVGVELKGSAAWGATCHLLLGDTPGGGCDCCGELLCVSFSPLTPCTMAQHHALCWCIQQQPPASRAVLFALHPVPRTSSQYHAPTPGTEHQCPASQHHAPSTLC